MANELVPAKTATDLPSLRAGQRVMVARGGGVVGASRHRRALAISGLTAGAAATVLIVAAPLFGVVAVGITGVTIVLSVRWLGKLRAILALVFADRLDDAERALEAIPTPLVLRGARMANLAQIRAVIAERRGDLATAVAHADECARWMPRPPRLAIGYHIVLWQNRFNRAQWLLELGRNDDARAQIAACGGAPNGEWYRVQYRGLVLHAAFAGAGELPDDTVLHDWLRDALRYNHTGLSVALLGWAFESRGDRETAEHAFAEAPSRLLRGTALLERSYPRLWAVLGPRLTSNEPSET